MFVGVIEERSFFYNKNLKSLDRTGFPHTLFIQEMQ